MEPNTKPSKHRGLALEAGTFVVLVAVFLAANYLYGRHAPSAAKLASPSPVASSLAGGDRANPEPSPSLTPVTAPTPVPFVVPELGVVFVLPGDLSGLVAAVVRPAGQASTATTVGFSTDRLVIEGCPAASGALGYLADNSSDTPGETVVGRVGQTVYYYRPPAGACDAETAARLANTLKGALASLKPTSLQQ